MKECEFRRRRCEIDISEINENLEAAQGFEKQRLEIDLEEKNYNLGLEIKLIEDCVVEIAVYQEMLDSLPVFSREEFEIAEQEYWEKRLLDDAKNELLSCGSVGVETIKSLQDIGLTIGKNKDNQITYERRAIEDGNILLG